MSPQRLDYRLRFTASEWACIEHELTRERGLWGPENPSPLDKSMLDSMEGSLAKKRNYFICVFSLANHLFHLQTGPSRMRKRLCKNYQFYEHYPDDPMPLTAKVFHNDVLYLSGLFNISATPLQCSKHQHPSSYDTPLYKARCLLFPHTFCLSQSSSIPPAHIAMSR